MSIPEDQKKSALFAAIVLQQTQMAFLFLGKTPHPDTGQPMRDLEAAQRFIDQIEVLQDKTQGNLTPDEANMIKESLTSLRMAFVEAVNEGPTNTGKPASAPAGAAADAAPQTESDAPAGDAKAGDAKAGEDEGDSRKKYSKNYGA